MKRQITQSFIAIIAFGLLGFASLNAQTTVTKTVGAEGADYTSFIAAIKAEAPDMSANDILILNLAEGVLFEPINQAVPDNSIGKALKITIQGAGADKTIIQGPYSESNFPPTDFSGEGKLVQWNDANMVGSEIVFKDLTFKYWGGSDNFISNGAIFNCNKPQSGGIVRLLFKNVVFDSNIGRSLIVTFRPSYIFEFDNCLFINNVLNKATNNTAANGIIYKGNAPGTGGGDLTVKNSTFMSNTFKEGITGALINMLPREGSTVESNIVIENNKAVNNKFIESVSKESVQSMIGITSFGTVNLSLKNNTLIGNKRADSKDVDIYISGYDGLTLTAENIIVNEAVDGTDGNPRLTVSGFKIDPTYTYTDSRIDFEMEDDLPKLFLDENKIGYLVHKGDGTGSVSVIPSSEGSFRVYSRDLFIIINGINPGETIELYSITGSLIRKVKASEDFAQIHAPSKGIYIVRIDKNARKVVVF